MKTSFRKRRGKKIIHKYNPNHDQLDKAIHDYLKKGGKITQIQPEEEDPFFLSDRVAVDEYLMGN